MHCTTQEDEAPPDVDDGTNTPVLFNAGKQFGHAAHVE